MTSDRDRLIELVDKAKEQYANDITDHTETEYIVECLLNNGVIVPPCKVGSTIYLPCLNDWGDIENYTITEFVLDNDGLCFVVDDEDREAHSIEIIGKEVFLTKEEVKQALAERNRK